MPTYAYRAISKHGERISGVADARTAKELEKELMAGGCFVQEIRRRSVFSWHRAPRPITRQSRLEIASKLVVLFRSGLGLKDILAILRETLETEVMQECLGEVEADVKAGRALSTACSGRPDMFDSLFIVSLRMGEKTGDMAGCLEEYVSFLRKEIEIRKKVDQALYYPAFIVMVAILAVIVLSTTVLPRITQLYSSLGSELPFSTRMVVGLAGFIGANWHFAVLLMLPVLAVIRLRRAEDAWFRNPLLLVFATPQLKRQMRGLHYVRSISMLLKSGMTISEAISNLHGLEREPKAKQGLATALQTLAAGGRMSDACSALQLFNKAVLGLVEVGERTACLPRMLDSAAALYEDQLESKLRRYVALVEPSLMLVMGGIVGSIVVLLYLPILTMADLIR